MRPAGHRVVAEIKSRVRSGGQRPVRTPGRTPSSKTWLTPAPIVRVFDVCARYGGDEFAVVMPGSHLESAAAVADRIRLRIADRQPPVPHEPGVTVSIGVAELQEGEHARDVLDRADRALYEAKKAGKNRVVATPPTTSP